jgi:MATE family multidrug resistance protein
MPSVHLSLTELRGEFKPMLALALPVVLAELAWVTMGIVDTLMVGPLGAEAIGAVGIGSSVFMGVCVFAMGLLLGLDTLVAQSYGAARLDDCHRWLVHGVALGLGLAVPVTVILYTLAASLHLWGLDPAVLNLTRDYLQVVTWSLLPLLLYAAFRRYLQATGSVRPIMIALVLANVVNALFNWLLIFGRFGLPALGVRGSAWATVLARVFMAGWLLLAIVYREWGRNPGLFHTSLRIDPAWLRRLYSLGFPAAMQITLEVGVFATATALAGRLAPSALAAHQIAINMAAFTFMVPYGISSAGAVRVGHAVGRADAAAVARAGWTALMFGAGFMSAAAFVFLTCGRFLIGAFTPDPEVLRAGVSLLAIASVFQLCDGLQGVATGVLRGLGDTRSPMIWNLAGHWLIGLPLGYVLCFKTGLGVRGLWWGLSLGLIICGVALLANWQRRMSAMLVAGTPLAG